VKLFTGLKTASHASQDIWMVHNLKLAVFLSCAPACRNKRVHSLKLPLPLPTCVPSHRNTQETS